MSKDTIYFGYLNDLGSCCGYLYYKHVVIANDAKIARIAPGNTIEELKSMDALYAAWVEAKIKEYGYVVYITARGQKAMLDAYIEQFNLSKYLYYRQEDNCFNSGYIDEPGLSVFVFKEPEQ